MANIKLTGHTWDTSGIWDTTEEKTQAEINSGLKIVTTEQSEAIAELPFTEQYENIAIAWSRTDKYINTNGNETSLNYYYQFSIAVTSGEKYILDGTNDYSKAIYATLNNGTPVRYPRTANNQSEVKNIEITIAENETTLVLQSNANDRVKYSLKKFDGVVLSDEIVTLDALSGEVTDVLPTASIINLFNPNDEDVVTGKYVARDGSLVTEATFNASGYIKIEQNVAYQFPVYAGFFGESNVIYVPYYTANKTYASFATGTYDSSTSLLTVNFTSAYAYYCRINFPAINSYHVNSINHNPETTMFTKTPYPKEFIPYGIQLTAPTNEHFIVSEQQKINPLYGKMAIFLGDSLCAGASASDGLNGWAGRIGRNNLMRWYNAGISGATFTSGLSGSSGVISDVNITGFSYDYIIIEGGTNDADLIGSALESTPEKYGSFTSDDYRTAFANTTYCGAIEKLLQNACNNAKQAKIGVIIAPKMGQLDVNNTDYTPEHNNRRKYFETLINICKKWGVPYLNLWDESILNPMLSNHYTYQQESNDGKYYTDGQHLTTDGYDYIAPIIESWMKTL